MNCLLEFFTMERQKKFINIVQNREECFEKALESYKRLFLTELDFCLKSLDSNINGEINNTYCGYPGCDYTSLCENIYKIVKEIKKNEIERFFDEIKRCYVWWISSNSSVALYKFSMVLNEYGLIRNNELDLKSMENRMFYRGRCSGEFLNKMDMFHVPFNKRYNISNSRFGLTGQPMLYLANSVADVIEELCIDIDDIDENSNLKISSFEFKNTKDRRIFDLRCSMFDYSDGKLLDGEFSKVKFFRNILCYICSFKKRKELDASAFKEEYVIPQMLAQILKQHNYGGICYYSTKAFSKFNDMDTRNAIKNSELNMRYRENLALFTNMRTDKKECPHDEKFFDELEISMPISIRNIEKCFENELISIYSEISRRCLEIYKIGAEDNKEKAQKTKDKAEAIVSFYSKVFAEIKVEEENYNDTKMGWLQIQLLRGTLKRLFAELDTDQEAENEPLTIDKKEMNVCNIYGETLKENVPFDRVHKDGILHKAQILYFINFIDDKWHVYIKNENMGETLYAHEDEIVKVLAEYNLDGIEKKKIGHFIMKDYGSVNDEAYFRNNFEYIEVIVCEGTNIKFETTAIWKEIDKIEIELQENYDRFKPIYQRSLPILLEYIKEKNKELG